MLAFWALFVDIDYAPVICNRLSITQITTNSDTLLCNGKRDAACGGDLVEGGGVASSLWTHPICVCLVFSWRIKIDATLLNK